MRENPDYALTDLTAVRDLVRAHPWATMISATDDGPVASHYPFLVDDRNPDELVLLSHVGRPDEALHQLGARELLVVFHGPSGYVSPGWYDVPTAVPTWNFTAVHCYGTPRILTDRENLAVLDRLVDHFENPLPDPFRMHRTLENTAYAERIVGGTVGFSMRVGRFVGKEKMSQDKPTEVVERVIAALRAPGPHHNPRLADRMDHVHGRTS